MATRPSSGSNRRRPSTGSGAVDDGAAAVGDSAPPPVPDPTPASPPTGPADVEDTDALFGDEVDDSDGGAAALAARRRAERSGGTPPPMPGQQPPADTDGEIIVSRALVQGFTQGSPVRPTGGVWAGKPIVLENSPHASTGTGDTSDYVVATCSAIESTVMPNCKTPVSRVAWHAGMRVRRDVYEAALAEHEARLAAGNAGEPIPASLPEGMDAVPAGSIRNEPIPSPAAVLAAGPGRVGPDPV